MRFLADQTSMSASVSEATRPGVRRFREDAISQRSRNSEPVRLSSGMSSRAVDSKASSGSSTAKASARISYLSYPIERIASCSSDVRSFQLFDQAMASLRVDAQYPTAKQKAKTRLEPKWLRKYMIISKR